MVKQKKNLEETTNEVEPIVIERTASENNIRPILEEIQKSEGIIGYILRNTNSAAIDLKDPTKLIDYAVLSSSAFEASEQLSKLFDLGTVKNIIIEGTDTKTIHLSVGGDNVSIFMDKNVDVKKILEKMHLP
jgi:predicted regulator of Ras-like GTPase activity (Roadblock/LC7/MglB family)